MYKNQLIITNDSQNLNLEFQFEVDSKHKYTHKK
jgi:hypothetical protein